jgi:hypothetical protein
MSSETLFNGSLAGDRADSGAAPGVVVGRRSRAVVVAVAPVILLAAFVAHPYIGLGLPDEAAIADAAASSTLRWGISHLVTGVAAALLVLAFLAIRSYLHDAGEQLWSARGVSLVAFGGTLYAMLPGLEFAALAAAETGGDVRAAQAAVEPWFVPVILASGVTSAVGIMCFAIGVSQIRPSVLQIPRFVVVALGIMAFSRIIPLTAVQFYLHALAALVALWSLAYVMWRHPRVMPKADPASG